MKLNIRKVKYYTTIIKNVSGSEGALLRIFSRSGVNYLAFHSEALDSERIRFSIFPTEIELLVDVARNESIELDGPHTAIHIEGDDATGACADVFELLGKANISTQRAFGIADIKKAYGIVVSVDEKNCDKAIELLRK
jgi:hypothetical protein